MRENPEIGEVIARYTAALRKEAATLKSAENKRTTLYNGILLRKGADGNVYRFETEAELFLSDGTPVSVFSAGQKADGTVLDSAGFDIVLSLSGEIDPLRAEMSSSPWYLLEDLSASLEKLIKSSYEDEIYAELIEKREYGVKENGKISLGQEAAFAAAENRRISFLWGPPGTGKTYTLSEIAYAFYKKGISVLILSQSNVAVDCAVLELSGRLKKSDEGKVLRFGSYRKKEIAEAEITLSSYDLALKKSPDLLQKKQELDYRKQIASFEEAGGVEKALSALRDTVKEREQALVYEAKVVGATLSRAVVSEAIFHRKFGAVLVDEASMCYVPQVLYAASLATSRLVVVGDFRQLPPIVTDPAAKPLLMRDVFQFLNIPHGKKVFYHPWLTMLNVQYRMHPEIASFVSSEFYGGLLKTADGVEEKRAEIAEFPPFPGEALSLVDLTNTYNVCGKTTDGSRFNALSALVTARLAAECAEKTSLVAVIAPYVSQVRLLRAIFADLDLAVSVSSVHQFQGSETDVVLFDTVDFLRQPKPGYLLMKQDEEDDVALRLVNVALTRARVKFVLVTNAGYFGGKLPEGAALKNLIGYLKERERSFTPAETEALFPREISGFRRNGSGEDELDSRGERSEEYVDFRGESYAPPAGSLRDGPQKDDIDSPPREAARNDLRAENRTAGFIAGAIPSIGAFPARKARSERAFLKEKNAAAHFCFFKENEGMAAEDVDGASEKIDLFLPDATGDEDAAKTLFPALTRAEKRGVSVRVYAENPAAFPAMPVPVEETKAAIYPLLFIDGEIVHFNPLFFGKWNNLKNWTSREPLSVRFVGRKTAEVLRDLLRSSSKTLAGEQGTALFGMKEDAPSSEETTGREVYAAACYLAGLNGADGVDGYFSLMKTLKKKLPFRFVKTKLGAECCFKKRAVFSEFFMTDLAYRLRLAETEADNYDDLLSQAKEFYGMDGTGRGTE